ncbi:MAG: hypothetical protein IPF59_08740 [Ignavibacteria bacterium]|nr:hypothetical protein [Ignavibacteria bacterium]
MKMFCRYSFVAILLFSTGVVYAQVETQIPFDESGKIVTLTYSQNKKIQLIDRPESFVEARLFSQSDSVFVLEILRKNGSETLRERKVITTSELRAIRVRVGTYLELYADADFLRPPDVDTPEYIPSSFEIDQSGRSALLWGSTLWSLFYYGTAATFALGLTDEGSSGATAAAVYLITGGLGYLAPALATKNAPVTEGAVTLSLGGMFQGAIHGWLVAGLVGGDEVSERVGFGLSVLTGVSESIAGYVIGTNTNIQEGHASVINTTEFYGMATGGLLAFAIMGEGLEGDATIRLASGMALAGTVGGIFVGNALGQHQHFTPTDASVYAVSALLGITLPIAFLTAVSPSDLNVRVASGLTVVGAVGGLFIGNQLVKGLDYRGVDGTGLVLGTFAGGLIGFGVGLLTEESQITPITSWAGAALGFGLGLAMSNPRDEGRSRGELKFDFNPLGLLLGSRSTVPVPVGSMTYRF